MKTKYLKKLAYIRKKNIIENVILFGAIVSANFASYLAYYDINALVVTDTSALFQYISSFTILFIVISASISVLLLFIQKTSLLISDEKGYISQDIRKLIHDAIGNKVFKFILTIIIFLYFYTGLKNSLSIMGILLLYITSLIIFRSENTPRLNHSLKVHVRIMRERNFIKKLCYSLRITFLANLNLKKTFQFINQGQYTQFLLSKVGILLILFSLALGVGRANYVQNHILVNLNNNKKTFVLYLSTSNGIALYDTTLQQVSFISWGNVKNLVFLSKERRSLNTLIDSLRKEK